MTPVKLINTTDLIAPGWRFVEAEYTGPDAVWEFHHGLPRNPLERLVRRPNLARYRAARQAAASAARAESALLISHLPRMAAATNRARSRRCPEVPHLAFSFNFTDLPKGADRERLARNLDGIDEFITFSEYEREVYAELFNQPVARFVHLPWAMDPPEPGPVNPVPFEGPYICAIGGEGRDYALLAKAMRALPETRLAIVARPHSIAGLEMPDNVATFTNLPLDQTWRLASDSSGIAIPLRDANTACGHITLVGAQLLSIPMVITRSTGVADYVDDATALMVPPQDLDAMVAALGEIADPSGAARARAVKAATRARIRHAPRQWADYIAGFCARMGRSG